MIIILQHSPHGHGINTNNNDHYIFLEDSIELFAVDRNTGRLYLARPLDQHLVGSYTVTVIVTDSALHKDSVDINVIISEEIIQDTDKQKTKTHHIITYCVMSAVIVAVVIGAVVVVMRLKNKVKLLFSLL